MKIGFESPAAYRQLRNDITRGAFENPTPLAGDRSGSKTVADSSSERAATAVSADADSANARPASRDRLEALHHSSKYAEARALSSYSGFKPGSPGSLVLSAMIEQMSGSDMPPRKGVFIDYRV